METHEYHDNSDTGDAFAWNAACGSKRRVATIVRKLLKRRQRMQSSSCGRF